MNTPDQVLAHYIEAIHTADTQALLDLYAPDARIFDMTMPWEHTDRETWAAMIAEWFRHVRDHGSGAEASRVVTRVSESMVLMTMLMEYYDDTEEGERERMFNRLTWVLVPHEGNWKILHEHTSAPLTEDDMTPVFEP